MIKALRYAWGLVGIVLMSCGGGGGTSALKDPTLDRVRSYLEEVQAGADLAPLSFSGISVADTSTEALCGEEVDYDLVECQPILVRRHYEQGREALKTVVERFLKIAEALGKLTQSDELQTVSVSGVSRLDEVTYRYESKELKLWALYQGREQFYLHARGDNYADITLTRELEQNPLLTVEVSRRGDEDWTLEILITGYDCDDNNLRSPERLKFHVTRDGEISQVKVMAYFPYWLFGLNNQPTCLSGDPETYAQTIYVDAVSNSVAAKGRAFFFSYGEPTEFQDASYESVYGFPGVCETGNIVCSPLREPKNPFCNQAGVLDVSFQSDSCSEVTAGVSEADYGAFADWVDPRDFYNLNHTIATVEAN